ncbi:MAG: helix-turn-helix transcriptional regulator [Cyanobacteria bacterium P01_A01_bin.80]
MREAYSDEIGEKISQRQIAEKLKITEATYRKLESGSIESISYEKLAILTHLYGCELTDLISIQKKKQKK